MELAKLNQIDEITMRLVHYLVTKENYQPVIVNGVDNEVWLENTEKKYEIIRINANYIHNDEQLKYDLFKTKSIVKQINKKTFSFKTKSLDILLNLGDNVKNIKSDKNIEVCTFNNVKDMYKDETIKNLFPELKNDEITSDDPMEFFMNVTNDISKKNEEKSRRFEKIFRKKIPYITYLLIALNILLFVLSYMNIIDVNDFSSNRIMIKSGEYYRIITAAFFHGGILHLVCNMYALYILGTQAETFFGKIKYIIIYFLSIIGASLLSLVLNNATISSIGASGAIFGLMGALAYFGYKYRSYLGDYVKKQLIPVIILNLLLGFSLSYVDNFGHIGGLIAGIFASMAVGADDDASDRTNGIITTIIYLAFLMYMLFFN